MPARLPDDEPGLVRLAAECSSEAFAALIERFRRHVRFVVSKHTDDRDDREDLQADITAKLLVDDKRALNVWRPRAPFAAYLTTIVTRHCIQWAERAGRLVRYQPRALPEHEDDGTTYFLERLLTAAPEDDPEVALDRSLLHTALRGALGRLPPDDRLIVALRYEGGLNGPSIARMLGISSNAARQRLFKALRRMERALMEDAPELFEPQ